MSPAGASAAPASSARAIPAGAPRGPPVHDSGVCRREAIRAESWSLDGDATITADVDVGILALRGEATVGGTLTAGELHLRGNLTVAGAASVSGVGELRGALEVGGTLTAGELRAQGPVRVRESMTARGGMAGQGELDVGSGLRTRTLRWDGELRIPGGVEAVEVDLRLKGDSRLGPVRARSVRVERAGPAFLARQQIRIDRIDAEEVRLAGVRVEFVRAPKVWLGPDASVIRLEGTVRACHASAHVGPEVRSPHFPGITR